MKNKSNKMLRQKGRVFMMLAVMNLLALSTQAETVTINYNYLKYTIDTTAETAELYGPENTAIEFTDLVIPDYIPYDGKDYPVVSIRNYAFGNAYFSNDKLSGTLKLGNNIRVIGDYAFSYCSELTNLIIGDAVETIGDEAFSNCNFKGQINFNKSITFIGKKAFFNCTKITSLYFPAETGSLTIGYVGSRKEGCGGAFRGCTNLKTIYCFLSTPPTLYEGKNEYNTNHLNFDKPKEINVYIPYENINSYLGSTGMFPDGVYGNFHIQGWKDFNVVAILSTEKTTISLDKPTLSLDLEQSETITATVSPFYAESLELSMNNPDIISLEKSSPELTQTGATYTINVKALKGGKVTLTANAGNADPVTCEITVNGGGNGGNGNGNGDGDDDKDNPNNPSGPGFSDSDITGIIYMIPDEERMFGDYLGDLTASNWESSNEDVAEVNKKGRVDAWEFGRTYISAKNNDDEVIAVFEVFVCPTISVNYSEGNSSYQHHVVYNSTPTLYIAAPKGYEIESVSHDGVDVTEAVVANSGVYQPATAITDNSTISVKLNSLTLPGDLNGDGRVDSGDINWLLEQIMYN